MPIVTFLALLVLAAPPETRIVEVAPALKGDQLQRSKGQDRAVVLIHGLRAHFFSGSKVNKAEMHEWQHPDSLMVKALAKEADVFAFCYGQTTAAEDVADLPDLGGAVRALRAQGYRQIVLVGHSAGGLIGRQFVEDHPDSGVTKVIQIDAPNGGSFWASVLPVRSNQREFVDSLSTTERGWTNQLRANKKVPAAVEMVCIVGTGALGGDGLVATSSQWPADLRDQGIPAYHVATTHREMVYCNRGVNLVARLVGEPQPRWDAKEVAAFCHKLGITQETRAK
jgi:pimeloyl-ACP methyl ester carboxylesterase